MNVEDLRNHYPKSINRNNLKTHSIMSESAIQARRTSVTSGIGSGKSESRSRIINPQQHRLLQGFEQSIYPRHGFIANHRTTLAHAQRKVHRIDFCFRDRSERVKHHVSLEGIIIGCLQSMQLIMNIDSPFTVRPDSDFVSPQR